jgi:hypothetical protein
LAYDASIIRRYIVTRRVGDAFRVIITVKHFVMTKGFGKVHGELSSLHGLHQRPDHGRS